MSAIDPDKLSEQERRWMADPEIQRRVEERIEWIKQRQWEAVEMNLTGRDFLRHMGWDEE